MSERLRTFVPFGGRLREMDPDYALKLAEAARKERKPPPIAVKTSGMNSAVRISAVMSLDAREPAFYRPVIAMVTTQARKLAEAAVWVGAVHAFVALGILAQKAGAVVIERESVEPPATTMRPSMTRPTMNPNNPLLGMAKPVDFDTFFSSAAEHEDDEPPPEPPS